MKIRIGQLLLCMIFLCGLFYSQTGAQSSRFHRKVDAETILFLFQNKIYKSLTAKLQEWQTAFEQDLQEESNVYEAFDVFSSAEPLYEAILNNWVNQFKDTYPPYIARAKYYCECAWEARGHKWASETTEKQFQEMNRYFALALEDIKSALTINPKLDVCYDMMIMIGMTVSNDLLKKNALSTALKYNPYGFHVRSTYLHALIPRWGGSYQEMEEFVEESEKYAVYNPELKKLRSHIYSDKAQALRHDKNYEEAIQYYNEALKFRETADCYAERGDCYYEQDDYRRALKDYESALDLKPNKPEYLRRKSNALHCLNRLSDAQETIEKAARLDPNDKWIKKRKDYYQSDRVKVYNHSKKGVDLLQANRYQEAIAEFTEAIRLNSDSPNNYYNRGLCYHHLKRYEEALKDYKEVLVRRRDDLKVYDAIGWIEYNLGRYDDALSTVTTIIKLDPNNSEAYFNRALNYIAKGWKREALADARRACELGYQRACPLVEQLR